MQFKHKGSSHYQTVMFGALFCVVVDCALMRFLFYVSSPGSPCLTNLKGHNTRNSLPSEHVKGPNFPFPLWGIWSQFLCNFISSHFPPIDVEDLFLQAHTVY